MYHSILASACEHERRWQYATRFASIEELNEVFVNCVNNIREYWLAHPYISTRAIRVDQCLFYVSKDKVWGNNGEIRHYLTDHEVRHVMDFVSINSSTVPTPEGRIYYERAE